MGCEDDSKCRRRLSSCIAIKAECQNNMHGPWIISFAHRLERMNLGILMIYIVFQEGELKRFRLSRLGVLGGNASVWWSSKAANYQSHPSVLKRPKVMHYQKPPICFGRSIVLLCNHLLWLFFIRHWVNCIISWNKSLEQSDARCSRAHKWYSEHKKCEKKNFINIDLIHYLRLRVL